LWQKKSSQRERYSQPEQKKKQRSSTAGKRRPPIFGSPTVHQCESRKGVGREKKEGKNDKLPTPREEKRAIRILLGVNRKVYVPGRKR